MIRGELTRDSGVVLRQRPGSGGCLVLTDVPMTKKNRQQPETRRPVCFLLVQIITFQQLGGRRAEHHGRVVFVARRCLGVCLCVFLHCDFYSTQTSKEDMKTFASRYWWYEIIMIFMDYG